MSDISEFQRIADPQIARALEAAGIRGARRELLEFEAPFFNPGAPEPVIRYRADRVTVWLYDDAASFEAPGGSEVFEQADYDGPAGLAEVLLTAFGRALAAPAG